MSEPERHEALCHRTFDVGLTEDNPQAVAIRFGEDVMSMTLEMAEVLAIQLLRVTQHRRELNRIAVNNVISEELERLRPTDIEKARADASFLRNYERIQHRAYNQTYRSEPKEAPSEN